MNYDKTYILSNGTKLKNKYMIVDFIGEGGFGITYKCQDILFNTYVAIKEFYPSGYANRNIYKSSEVTITYEESHRFFLEWERKFFEEAKILAQCSDAPSIVKVFDFFEENNTAYIVMEYLDGITLSQYLKTYGVFKPDDLINRMIPIMDGLSIIHGKNLIHRDISPDNIMMLTDGSFVLYDFGSSRMFGGDKSLSVMLKKGYSPEEQYRSKGKQGPWTDVYSLCATMYACVTGHRPPDAMDRIVADRLITPYNRGIYMLPFQEQAILKGMSVRAEDRFRNVNDLKKALLGISSGVMSGKLKVIIILSLVMLAMILIILMLIIIISI